MLAENSSLEKSIEKFQNQSAVTLVRALEENAVLINGVQFLSGNIETGSIDIMKTIAYHVRNSSDNSLLVIGSVINEKANILVMVSDRLVKEKNINAVTIIKEIAGEISGGGGEPFLATAGGKNTAGIPAAIKKAEEYIKTLIF